MPEITWELFRAQAEACTQCGLHAGILHKVPGQGDPHAPLMLIGEGPGQREDEEGYAFIGPAGQLLTKMLLSVSLPRDRVYICNIVKCRPPQNRVPQPEEAAACAPLLQMQLALVQPKVIVLLGSTAARAVLGGDIRITRDRGRWFERRGTFLMPTYHPSALLRDPAKKREAWQDMISLRDRLIDLGLYTDLYGEDTDG